MKHLLIFLLCVLLFVGCVAADQETKVTHQSNREVLFQSTVPVLQNENGNPFLQIDGEKLGVDCDANLQDGEDPTEFVVIHWKDQNGRISIDFETVAPLNEQP